MKRNKGGSQYNYCYQFDNGTIRKPCIFSSSSFQNKLGSKQRNHYNYDGEGEHAHTGSLSPQAHLYFQQWIDRYQQDQWTMLDYYEVGRSRIFTLSMKSVWKAYLTYT